MAGLTWPASTRIRLNSVTRFKALITTMAAAISIKTVIIRIINNRILSSSSNNYNYNKFNNSFQVDIKAR